MERQPVGRMPDCYEMMWRIEWQDRRVGEGDGTGRGEGELSEVIMRGVSQYTFLFSECPSLYRGKVR